MSLQALLQQRRYRRLFLALGAALVAHFGLLISGDWGISPFSAPSKEDRVLTLTLEYTAYEGLKEAAMDDADTMNEVPLKKLQVSVNKSAEPYAEIEKTRPRDYAFVGGDT